jgi:hypothetical protein
MAKATNRHKPAPPGRKPAAFSAAEWVPFDQAVTRVKAALGSRELALRALLGDLRKEKDGLASSVPRVARDGSLTFEHLKPSFWKEAVFDSRTATIRVPPISPPARPNVAPAPAARDVERHSAFSDPRDSFIGNTSDWFSRDLWPPLVPPGRPPECGQSAALPPLAVLCGTCRPRPAVSGRDERSDEGDRAKHCVQRPPKRRLAGAPRQTDLVQILAARR